MRGGEEASGLAVTLSSVESAEQVLGFVDRSVEHPRMGVEPTKVELAARRMRQSPYWAKFAKQASASLHAPWSHAAATAEAIGEGALLALVGSDASSAATVSRAFEQAARLVDGGRWEIVDDLIFAQQLSAIAFGYDWVYRSLSPSIRRLGAELLVELAERAHDGFSSHLDDRRLDAFNNHAFWNHAGVGAAAFAALGENARAEALARRSVATFSTTLLPVLDHFVGSDGTWNEGTQYNQVLGRSAFVWMDAARSSLSEDPFAAGWVRSLAYHWVYLTRPDGGMIILGDWYTDGLAPTIRQLMMRSGQVIARAASAHRDPYLQRFAESQIPWIRSGRIPMWLVLWFDPDLAARPLSELPTSRLFRPPLSRATASVAAERAGTKLAILRSDWGPHPRIITLSMGDWLSHHAHNDSNSFSIHYREALAIDPGFGGDAERFAPLIRLAGKLRNGVRVLAARRHAARARGEGATPVDTLIEGPSKRAGAGLVSTARAALLRRTRTLGRRIFRPQEEISWRFYRRTSAHNSLLVPVPRAQAELDEPLLLERGWGYDGGQRVPLVRGRPRTLEGYYALRSPEYPSSSLFETGSCHAFETNDVYDYVVGDATKAYHRSQLTRFLRHMVFVKPDVLVVFDVVSTPAERRPIWLLQTVRRPHIVDGTLVAENAGGALHITRLSPAVARTRIVKAPGMAIYGKSGTGVHRYRTEVQAPPGEEHRFLHVVHMTDAGSSFKLQATARERDGELIVEVRLPLRGWRIVLRADGEPHVELGHAAPGGNLEGNDA